MRVQLKKLISLSLVLALLVSFAPPSFASGTPSSGQIREAMGKAAGYLLRLKQGRGSFSPWSYLSLIGTGAAIDTQALLRAAEQLWQDESLQSGDTSSWCLLVFTLLAAGENPSSFHGQNLIQQLQRSQLPDGKFPDNLKAGGEELLNAHVWAVLALAAAGAEPPDRYKAIQWLLEKQHTDGSFYWYAPDAKTPDVDSTGMALMALGALGVKKDHPAVQKAVAYLQKVQKPNGGFDSWGAENPESCSMVIQGLMAVGIDPTGPELTKPGGNPVTAMLKFQLPDGSFEHIKGGGPNEMATQQALMALADLASGTTLVERLRATATGSSSKTEKVVARFTVGKRSFIRSSADGDISEEMDVAPFIEGGRTYVPVRYLAYALGVPQSGVTWDDKTKTVTLSLGRTVIKLTVGKKELILNGAPRAMDVSPINSSGRVFLPARFVAEAFGYQVQWLEASREVVITAQK
ncbi:MAG: stalk domain-containing protein [Thermacetogeniaceae bacterium]